MGVTVVGQTIVVLAGNVFTLGAGLPFQIYVARVLGVNQLGRFGLVEAVVVTLSGFVGFGIAQTAVRFIPEYLAKGEHEHIRKLCRASRVVQSKSPLRSARSNWKPRGTSTLVSARRCSAPRRSVALAYF